MDECHRLFSKAGARAGNNRAPIPAGDRSVGRHGRQLLIGAAAGVFASLVTGAVDKLLLRLISEEQKEKEHQVREDSPHQLAGPRFAGKLLGREITPEEKQRAQLVFGLAYGIGWGLIYSVLRRNAAWISRYGGLPFVAPFFMLCDGGIAPMLQLTPI